jgi:2-dehydro-3-deoxygalactonokinase
MSGYEAAWVAVDWGTSKLRAWIMDKAGGVLTALESDKGMGCLAPAEFEPALLELIAPHMGEDRLPVIACGMVGAKQGWAETPYVEVPCVPPGALDAMRPPVTESRLDIRILPGVKQATPPDVMRGEETQIAGYLCENPDFDGVLCLLGTHSKWVHISAREIVSFRTFMTGELFRLLSQQSVLRHSVNCEGWDNNAFLIALNDALSAPQRLGARLFAIRAGSLLEETPPETNRASLSGLLLGLEIAGARDYWLGRDIVLIGDPKLTMLYRRALSAQGAMVRETDGEVTALAGLQTAYEEMLR